MKEYQMCYVEIGAFFNDVPSINEIIEDKILSALSEHNAAIDPAKDLEIIEGDMVDGYRDLSVRISFRNPVECTYYIPASYDHPAEGGEIIGLMSEEEIVATLKEAFDTAGIEYKDMELLDGVIETEEDMYDRWDREEEFGR